MTATSPLLHLLRQLTPDDGSVPDADLLRQYADHRDEAAFELLLVRHGGMVWGVCWRVAADPADAEDAFQATALALAQHAGAIRGKTSVGGWLFRVAYRAALETRARRREEPLSRIPDRPGPGPDPASAAEVRDLARVIDAELNRLPETFRIPFVLCELEGRSNAEAAAVLGCPVGTVESRLTRARARLRDRLAHRGVTLCRGSLIAGAVPSAVQAAALRTAADPSTAPHALRELATRSLGNASLGYLRAAMLFMVGVTALALTVAVLSGPPQAENKEPAKVTAEEQTLPTAFARLGSPRFRHPGPVFHAAFAPDGKTVATAALGSVSVWETATGKLLRRIERADVPFHRVAFSADGKSLYAVAGPTQDGCELLTLDPATGKEHSRRVPGKRIYRGAEFNSDATRLAVFSAWDTGQATLIDPATGKELIHMPTSWQGSGFTADGKRLILAGGNEVVRLVDATTGKETVKLEPKNRRPEWARWSSKGAVLLAGHNWVERWDPQRNVSVWKDELLSSGRGLEVSPDGKWVAHVSLYGVTVFDVETGKKAFHSRKEQYTAARFGLDSNTLALTSMSGALSLWDITTGKPLAQSPDLSGGVSGLIFSHDGQTLAAIAGEQWVSWDLSPKVPDPRPSLLANFTTLAPGLRVAVRPDSFQRADLPAEFVNPRSGDLIHRFDPAETGDTVIISQADGRRGVFSGDGRRFVGQRRTARSSGGEQTDLGLAVWDVQTGKRSAERPAEKGTTVIPAVSQNGKAVAMLFLRPGAVAGPRACEFTVWEPDTGRTRWARDLGTSAPFVAFARGGSWLIVQEIYATLAPNIIRGPSPQGPQPLFVLDAVTGKELLKVNGPALGLQPLLFADQNYHWRAHSRAVSPDGRTAAISGYDGTIYLWDLLTDQERCQIVHPGPVHDLAFSPNGRTLAATSLAAPIMLYDVYGTRDGASRKPTAVALSQAWDDLANPESAAAFRAVRAFVAAGPTGVRVLQERMRAARPPSSGQIEEWIKELGSEKFKTREQATAELTKIVRRAEPQLRAALQKPASLEFANRVRQLLARTGKLDAEELRAARAVEVVSVMGSPEARQLLAEWEKGDEVLRREAKAASIP